MYGNTKLKRYDYNTFLKQQTLPMAACKPQGGRAGEDNTGTAKSITT